MIRVPVVGIDPKHVRGADEDDRNSVMGTELADSVNRFRIDFPTKIRLSISDVGWDGGEMNDEFGLKFFYDILYCCNICHVQFFPCLSR
jgi:hypothetical protein